MTLALTIVNVERLDNGVSTRLRLDRHGASIGRSPQADWSLPDPQLGISSSHCEIAYRDGAYVLTDRSTNGTYVNGGPERLASPHEISDGDEILIGHYRILARLEGAEAPATAPATPAEPQWRGWESHGGAAPAPAPASLEDWGAPPPRSAMSGAGAMSSNWAAPRVEAPAPSPSGNSVWGDAAPAPTPASAWSSPVSSTPAEPSAADVWGKLAEVNQVDWARGSLAAAPAPLELSPAPRKDPFGLAPPTRDAAAEWAAPRSASPRPTVAPTPPPTPPAPAPSLQSSTGDEWGAFLAGAGLGPSDIRADPRVALGAAGNLLRRLVAGMVVMLEARARAKAQLGAQGTSLEFEGNNPLKFARDPQKATAQLLSPSERGFMPPERAVEDAFKDLQAHQMATLGAMQGALAACLARFSPQAIRERAERGGLLAKIIPTARDAELWRAYEREFEGVARGSDEAFMDVFAKEFRQAYEQAAAELKRKG